MDKYALKHTFCVPFDLNEQKPSERAKPPSGLEGSGRGAYSAFCI